MSLQGPHKDPFVWLAAVDLFQYKNVTARYYSASRNLS